MKKWVKYLLMAGCIALFLFLMLPFLVPSSAEDTARFAAEKQPAKAQIFTSNPLTPLMNRLARLFGGRSKHRAQRAPAQNPSPAYPKEELFLTQRSAMQAPDDFVTAAATPQDPVAATAPQSVYVVPVDNNVEWVLIQQHAPEDSPSGMHEINVKEDAYTRYVKQERLARTSPATRTNRPEEVPDSKLARLFKPFTQFFSRKDTPAAQGIQLASGDTAYARRSGGPSDPLTRNQAKQARSLPKAQDVHTAFRTPGKSSRSSHERNTSVKLTDLINPARTIKQAAQLLANTLYPSPSSAQQEQEKEDFYESQQNNYQQLVTNRLRAHLLTLSEGADPVDQLGKTTPCDVTKGLISIQAVCRMDDSDISQLREANRALFEERTHIPLPPTRLTPVLGVADMETLPQMGPDELDEIFPEYPATKEIYRYMLEKSNCTANSCYWVANSIQQKEEMKKSVDASGVDFQGDPLHVYDQISAQFTQEKLAALPPDATDEQKEQVRTQAQQAAPPYVLYTQENMEQLRQQLQSSPAEAPATLYIASAADAHALAESWQYNVPFFYGKQAQALTGDEQTVEDRASILINDLADHVIFMQEVRQDIEREAGQQAVGNVIKPVVQDLQEQLANELSEFDKNNQLGKTKK